MMTENISGKLTLLLFAALYAALGAGAVATVTLVERSVFYIPAFENSVGNQYFGLFEYVAEQLEYDPLSKQIWVVGEEQINVFRLGSDLSLTRLYVEYLNDMELKQVKRCGKYFLITGDDDEHPANGRLFIYKRYNPKAGFLQLVQSIPVGARPDDVIVSKDCRNILVGIVGSPFEEEGPDGDIETDPPGHILRLQFKSRDLSKPFKRTIIGFQEFDSRVDELKAEGVIQYNEAVPLSYDLQPEYLVFNRQQTKAWASLQINNAIAEIDLKTNKITRIKGLGFKNHNEMDQGLDPSDEDGAFPEGIKINTWPVLGARQPDQMALITAGGKDYLILANEGEDRSSVRTKVGEVTLDSAAFCALDILSILGDPDKDGNYTELYSFGARDNAMLDTDTLGIIADTGDDIEQKVAQWFPELFNSEARSSSTIGDRFDQESNNLGSQPESVATFCICGGSYWAVFSGLEKPGIIVVSTIDSENPSAGFKIQQLVHGIGNTMLTNVWRDLYRDKMAHLLQPEGLRVVPAKFSPSGKPLLLVSGSVSSTLTVYEINVTCDD